MACTCWPEQALGDEGLQRDTDGVLVGDPVGVGLTAASGLGRRAAARGAGRPRPLAAGTGLLAAGSAPLRCGGRLQAEAADSAETCGERSETAEGVGHRAVFVRRGWGGC